MWLWLRNVKIAKCCIRIRKWESESRSLFAIIYNCKKVQWFESEKSDFDDFVTKKNKQIVNHYIHTINFGDIE